MRWLEETVNFFTDMDWQWYPFVSLRPSKREVMDNSFVARVTLYYMPIFGIFSAILLILFPNIYFLGIPSPFVGLIASLLFYAVFFFLGMRLIVATAWNSRAQRLNKQKRDVMFVTG